MSLWSRKGRVPRADWGWTRGADDGWKTSDRISAISVVLAVAGFAFGYCQYQTAENWKRSEFVAGQIKDFYADKINESVLLMMDFNPAHVNLLPEGEAKYVDVSSETLLHAIAKEGRINGKGEVIDKSDDFTDTERLVRQDFEHFLYSLSRLNYYLDRDAIQPEELCADFHYAVGLMEDRQDVHTQKLGNSGRNITPFASAVHDYLTRWKWHSVQTFMQRIDDACDDGLPRKRRRFWDPVTHLLAGGGAPSAAEAAPAEQPPAATAAR